MAKKDIIVIGGSTGSLAVILEIANSLPAGFAASIFFVWHMPPDAEGVLPGILNKQIGLPASHAKHGEPIKQGHIYIAPPDRHLLLEEGYIKLSRGPKENRFRPAIDPLFRSAALSYGNRAIGVLLSGRLDDGVAGLWAIKACGGTVVIQDPATAEQPSMPASALKATEVDYCASASEIGRILSQLVTEDAPSVNIEHSKLGLIKREVDITLQNLPFEDNILDFGTLSVFTCPECHGVLTELNEGSQSRYRCHTGHAYSAASLLSAIADNIDEAIWNAIRGIEENVMLLNHMGDHFAEANQPHTASAYFNSAKQVQPAAKYLSTLLTNRQPFENLSSAEAMND